MVPKSVASADVVAANSHATKQALIEHYKTPPEKITVIPCGIAPYFKRITDPVLLEATRHKFDLRRPLVLSVGTLEPRKNHLGLIKAFYEVQQNKENSAQLAIAGGKGWLYEDTLRTVKELKLENKVRFLGRGNIHADEKRPVPGQPKAKGGQPAAPADDFNQSGDDAPF